MIAPFSKVFVLVVSFASVAIADDFKTVDGKEYKNVKVSRVETDGIVLTSKSGISKVYFTELPKEVQERYHYDAVKAAEFTSEQNEKIKAPITASRRGAIARQRKSKIFGRACNASAIADVIETHEHAADFREF
jgi:hypothetical protein